MKNCKRCQKATPSNGHIYCSVNCRKEARKESQRVIWSDRDCMECGTRLSKHLQKFCSKKCSSRYWDKRRVETGPIRSCLVCAKRLSCKQRKYCSRQCANGINNKIPRVFERNRKSRAKICTDCGIKFETTIRGNIGESFCKDCYADYKARRDSIMKADCTNADIRTHARSRIEMSDYSCQECGYSKHVQVCHIKAVKDFGDSATLHQINHPDNLVKLCPNCHWEFDHLGLVLTGKAQLTPLALDEAVASVKRWISGEI